MAVMSMRTFTYLQPGERQGCVGCHESRAFSGHGPAGPPRREVLELIPPVGPRYAGGVSFARTVQPILDRYCIRCHGLDGAAGGVNLLGTMPESISPTPAKLIASTAYATLMGRGGLVSVAHRNRETYYSKPKDYFSHAGRLAGMLLSGHKGRAKLDSESFRRIVQWLDVNAPFNGDYSWNKAEWLIPAPPGLGALRDHVRATFGAKLAAQPFAALVNTALPDESRILRAPLAVEAGGWGQLQPRWSSTRDDGYRKMRDLVRAAIAKGETHDVAGTCNRRRCLCKSCWVRQAPRPPGEAPER